MTPKLADRVKETSTTTGTGSYALAGAASGFQSFGAALANGDQVYYVAEQAAGDWEIGIGTYASAGPTLARTQVLASSNANAAVNWSAGTRNIFCAAPANTMQPVRHAFGQDVDTPDVNADASLGYGKGSLWVGAVGFYICTDPADGAAVWVDLQGLLETNINDISRAAHEQQIGRGDTWDTTTNATPIDLQFYIQALPGGSTGLRALVLTATVLAVDQANQDTKAFRSTFLVKENPSSAGDYILIGAPTMSLVAGDSGASAWTCTISGGLAQIRFTCTGASGKTINWFLDVRVDSDIDGDGNTAAGS